MIAYLSVLIEEFEENYLKFSNLQNYQEALAARMRTLFTEITEGKKEESISLQRKKEFLESAEKHFENNNVPSTIEIVWQAMEELDYIWGFIDDLRDGNGMKSKYNKYFLQHYNHCNKILKTKEGEINHRLSAHDHFKSNLEELKRIDDKKNSDTPITHKDNLAHIIMERELNFDFETHKMKPAESLR